MRTIILDYGAGNLRSVLRAVEHAGFTADIADDPRALDDAEAVILPGVGAAADTMSNLRARGVVEPIKEYIDSGRPFLGVCMGQQALFDVSEEGGEHECLGILPGRVVRFSNGLKVPHMGWNQVRIVKPHPIFDGIDDGSYFYFVHSYYVDPQDKSVVATMTDYGLPFVSSVWRDNIFACQFHPEKSQALGLALISNFLKWRP